MEIATKKMKIKLGCFSLFIILLSILFITLKLTGVIAWSWLWVLSPLWLPAVVTFCIIVILTLVVALFIFK